MVVSGFCCESKLKLKKVTSKSELNSLYYQKIILEFIFENKISVLCGKYINKVKLHLNKVPSHSSKSTAAYLVKKNQKRK